MACLWYAMLTLAMTWPVAAHLAGTLPSDFGDSLLNCWILGWNADHVLRAARGDIAALAQFWHGNIFHPERYTLGYSELLFAQSLQILPVYAATRNLILCYNLVFLSTFVLSGLGMYLLVRELTGDWRAAFVAGIVFGFLPYRIDQAPHVQSLSSQWMPFVFYALRRYFETRSRGSLVGMVLASVAQNLSCGYFLVYFSLFVPLHAFHEMASRRLLGDRRVWAALAVAGLAVAGCTLPFMTPYYAVRDFLGPRSLDEVIRYSADVYAYLTAPARLTLWGSRLRAFARPEGALFPGFMALALSVVAVGVPAWRLWNDALEPVWKARRRMPREGGASTLVTGLRRAGTWLGLTGTVVSLLALILLFTAGPDTYLVAGIPIRVTGVRRVLRGLALSLAVLFASSATARALGITAARVARHTLSGSAFFTVCLVLAWWMSLGPRVTVMGDRLGGVGIYRFFYDNVAGFDGLRVPARMAMVVGFFLAILSGLGLAEILRRTPRRAGLVAVLTGLAVLVESAALPFPLARRPRSAGAFEPPPATIEPGASAPPVYRYLAGLPRDTVLVEFPFGEWDWEVRHVYYSTMHWHPILNGYSGYFPHSYLTRRAHLRSPLSNPATAWQSLKDSRATHAVVHGVGYRKGQAEGVGAWLTGHGARLVAEFGTDRVYDLLPPAASQGRRVTGTQDYRVRGSGSEPVVRLSRRQHRAIAERDFLPDESYVDLAVRFP